MAKRDYSELAAAVIAGVGGKENIQGVIHCMTRLRFGLHDASKESSELEKIPGVLRVIHAGGQTQVVIGTTVDMVYEEVCKQGGFQSQVAIQEHHAEDLRKEKPTVKSVFGKIIDGLTGSLTPVLPAYIVAGIYKMIITLLGPGYMNLLVEGSDILRLLTIVGDACYYFAPMFTAWSASKKFNCSPILAMIMAGIMIHPSMLEIVSAGEAFTVFGIPMRLVNYTQAVIPIVMTTWALSVVERFFKKVVPDIVRVMVVPVLTVLVMLPVALCLFGPICYYVMSWLASLIIWLSDTAGVLAMALIGATWFFIVMFGMHIPILTVLLPAAMSIGYDPVVFPASIATSFVGLGVGLGYALKVKGKEEKVLAWEYFVTMLTANIGEPFLYGVMMRNKKVLAYTVISGAIGGALMGLLKCKVYTFSGVGFIFLNPIRFGEDVVKAAIVGVICVIIPLLLSLIFGVDNKKEGNKNA